MSRVSTSALTVDLSTEPGLKEEPPAATGSVSLAGSTVTVQSNSAAEVKLTCACHS